MRRIISKVNGIIAVILSAISIGLMIWGLLIDTPVEQGVSAGFACWVFSIIIALISVVAYIVDGVFCLIKVFRKIRPGFNLLSALLYIASAPMVFFVGAALNYTLLFYVYYLGIFVLQIVDIVKHIKMQKEVKDFE